jgi:arylsulfatase A-like enzyme/Flp pilus assembly protein TadD
VPRPTRQDGTIRWPVLVLAAVGAALVVSAAWWLRGPVQHPINRQVNLVLITIDTLRADALGAYGSATARTPWIDRLASAGVRFETARAHNVVTLPSHANIVAGLHPQDHGVRDNAGYHFPPDRETLATLLKGRGYRTGAFVSAFPLDSRFGLDRGFDIYEDSFVDARPATGFRLQERPGIETVALARKWVDEDDTPFFLWVHLFEPHDPYVSRYEDDVAAADSALEPILAPILEEGRNGNTLVVLTSDHGESLGEHGEATHGIFGYDATLRVPLIFYLPRLWEPRVVNDGARHVDILPTVLNALSMSVPEELAGGSLVSLMNGSSTDQARRDTYFEALSGTLNRGWAPLYGIVRDHLKYVDLPIPELYDLQIDPRELRNLAKEQPSRVEELRSALKAYKAQSSAARRMPQSADTRERLRSLGYVSSSASTPEGHFGESDDPKRLVGLDALMHEVSGLFVEGQLDRAAARCRELVQKRPGMAISRLMLAQIERERGNLPGAIEALQGAQRLTPDDPETLALLGASLTEAGRAAEAAAELAKQAGQDDADVQVLTTYAIALARLGKTDEALAALARARERDSSNARLLLEIGTVRVMAGRRDEARRDFEAALALNPAVARAHTSLGVLEAEAGRPDQAAPHWREAVRLDPREYRTLAGIGLALSRSGRDGQARPFFEFLAASAPPAGYEREAEGARAWLRSR